MFRSTWTRLGIEPTSDRDAIRRAYARRLKETNPEDDPQGFSDLRQALEAALRQASNSYRSVIFETADEDDGDFANPEPEARDPERANAAALAVRLDSAWNAVMRELRASPCESDRLGGLYDTFELLLAQSDIARHVAYESTVLAAVARAIPQSDPILQRALDTFRLDPDVALHPSAHHLRDIADRLKTIARTAGIDVPSSPDYAAFQILKKPRKGPTFGQRLQPRLMTSVPRLLANLRAEHDELPPELNAQNVAGWDRLFSRPYLQPWTLWGLLISPLALLLAASPVPAAAVSGMFCTVAYVSLAFHYAVAWPRHLIARRQRSARFRFGWYGAAPALVICAAVAPYGRAFVELFYVASAAIVYWAAIAGRPRRYPRQVWFYRAIAYIALSLWWIALQEALPRYAYQRLAPAVFGLVLANTLGEAAIFHDLYQSATASLRRKWFAFFSSLTVLATSAAIASIIWPRFGPIAVALTVIVGVFTRMFVMAYGEELFPNRFVAIPVGIVMLYAGGVMLSTPRYAVAAGAAIIVARAVMALRRGSRAEAVASSS